MSKGGKITIRYRSIDQLDEIVERFKKIPEPETKE
jgi:uncharacterized membrane protein